jgi:hypothetical protein
MTLQNPKLIIKANNIQDNLEYLNKKNELDFKTPIPLEFFSTSLNNFNFQNFLNNNFQTKLSYGQKEKNKNSLQINETPQIIPNYNNSLNFLNIPNNSKDDNLFQNNNEPLYKNIYLNQNNIIQNNDNNKSLVPHFFFDSNNLNYIKTSNKILNRPSKGLINKIIKTNDGVKKKHIFNKFKVYRIEPRKERDRIIYKLKHKRKYKPDDIRKKIKARFHKSIKNIVNENLKQAGSKHIFSFLPQIFISSISREQNHQVLNMSYRDLLKKDFISEVDESKYKNKRVDLAKYKNNLNVLEYLDKNPDICEKSGFDLISKMKYGDLLDEYFKSDEFDRAVNKLREENEEEDYINEYIKRAKGYVKFFSEVPLKIKNKNRNKKNESLAIEIKGNEDEKSEKEIIKH